MSCSHDPFGSFYNHSSEQLFSPRPSVREDVGCSKEAHRALSANLICDKPLPTLPSAKDDTARLVARALLDHRASRGGGTGSAGNSRSSDEISPERFSAVFAQAAANVLTAYEINQLVATLRSAPETKNDYLQQFVDLRVEQFHRDEPSLSDNPRDRLAVPSGPANAELGLMMHCQTKDWQIGSFWDDQNQTIYALQQKGLSSEFTFGFDLHWRAGLPGRQNRGCPAAKWQSTVRRIHDELTLHLLNNLPFHLLLVAGSCPKSFHRRVSGEGRPIRLSLAPAIEVDSVVEVYPGGCCRITIYIPHPAHVLYNKPTSLASCMILDSVISFYLWLLNKDYNSNSFARLAEDMPHGVPNGTPFHRLSAYRVEEKSCGRILEEHEYERPFWLGIAKFLEANPADLLRRGKSVVEAANDKLDHARHRG